MAYFETIYNKNEDAIGYRAQIRIAGFKPESKSGKKLSDLKKWANKREAEIREGKQSAEDRSRKTTLTELIEKYTKNILPYKTTKERSKQMQKIYLSFWKKRLGAYTLNHITPAVITHVRDELSKTRKPSTTNRYMAILSHVFTKAYKEWGLIPDNPFKKITILKEPRGRVRFLTEKERDELLAAAKKIDELLYLFIILALSTGARKSELLNLKWADVDFKANKAILQETKNNERRAIFFYGAAFDALQTRYICKRKGFKYVFAGRRFDEPINIYTPWYKVIKTLNIKDFHIHDLRHCYATELAKNGASLNDLAELLGHKNFNQVKRYAHQVETHAKSMVKKMNENLNKKAG